MQTSEHQTNNFSFKKLEDIKRFYNYQSEQENKYFNSKD